MNGTELLCGLFASVPDHTDEVTRVRGRIGGDEAASIPMTTFIISSDQSVPAPADRSKQPYTIKTIIEQIGGYRLDGAIVYIGCDPAQIEWRHPNHNKTGETRGSGAEFRDGVLHYDVGIELPVNGKPGEDWRIVVTYELDDTYEVWIHRKGGALRELLNHAADVYCDSLKEVVERFYDSALSMHNESIIPG